MKCKKSCYGFYCSCGARWSKSTRNREARRAALIEKVIAAGYTKAEAMDAHIPGRPTFSDLNHKLRLARRMAK